MKIETLLSAKYHADELDLDSLIALSIDIGRKQGMEEAWQDIPENCEKAYEAGFIEGVESAELDLDKIALAPLIPETGLRNWNEMTPNERMAKMHEVWEWKKEREI